MVFCFFYSRVYWLSYDLMVKKRKRKEKIIHLGTSLSEKTAVLGALEKLGWTPPGDTIQ